MRNSLSVCIASYNEQANIERSLRSVVAWVDEIVLVDGKSTDATVDKAKRLGKKVKVYSYPNPPNFLLNRQRAIDKATGAWILVLDADEIVTPQLSAEIKRAIVAKDKAAYWIPRLNYFLGESLKKGGVYPDYCLRLFKRKAGYQPTNSLHDQIKVEAPTNEIGYLQNPLQHYPYPSFEVYLRKWIKYSSHEADTLLKKGAKPGLGLGLKYCLFYPKFWFLKIYFRHKGFQDGFPGFVFAMFSALRYLAIYIKIYEKHDSQ